MPLPFTLKRILNQKNSYRNSNISPCKNILKKNPLKQNQNPSRYHNSITNLKFQHKPKYHLSKISLIKIDLLPRGQNPLSYYILYNESKHNNFALVGKANKCTGTESSIKNWIALVFIYFFNVKEREPSLVNSLRVWLWWQETSDALQNSLEEDSWVVEIGLMKTIIRCLQL